MLNGAIGYGVFALGVLSLRDLLVDYGQASALSFLAAVAGFVALLVALIVFNLWLFRYVAQAQAQTVEQEDSNN